MKYEVEHELMQKVLNYLVSRPYAEVYKLVDSFKNLSPVSVQPAIPQPPVLPPESSEDPQSGNA